MSDYQEIFLDSPLSELTRKVRRNLLIFSTSLFMILKGDLVPTSVTPLGITISEEKLNIIPNFIGLIVIYYLVKFFLYMQVDGKLAVYKAHKAEFPDARASMGYKDFMKHVKNNHSSITHRHGLSFLFWSLARNTLDIFFPLAIGCFSIFFLWSQ
ncbi:hypothetical protein [Pseudomonas sp. BMS12]|uniref:hypothetical protein n=1 Tax=Pseudomonas sp. BMS12 TaxID=1796033 RepID=UPI00128FE9C1|nr:hypothetical protein [Pseudomonas sp. BMS12]